MQPDINLDWEELLAEEAQTPSIPEARKSNLSTTSDSLSGDEDDSPLPHIAITEHMKRLQIDREDGGVFLGASSGFMLIKDAMTLKSQYTGETDSGGFKRTQYWESKPVRHYRDISLSLRDAESLSRSGNCALRLGKPLVMSFPNPTYCNP